MTDMRKVRVIDALVDAAPALIDLAAQRGRIAVVFDSAAGWCVTDDMDVLRPAMGSGAPEYRVIAYTDWCRPTLEEAFVRALEIQHSRR